MMVQMLGVFAEFERALIVERITAGLERKAARGGWCGGQRPYGLNIAADRNSLERNPTEAPLVPVMFDRYANRKAGSSALADWLNEQGYRTKNGRLWSKESVITVIRNRVYIGEIYYRGNWYPAPHEPLIPKELFDKAQAILTERREDRSKRAANPAEYLLTGRVRCGRCGQAYVGTAAHGRNGRYTYYTCFTRARYGTKHCANDRLPAERLEQAVTRRLWQVLDDNDLIDRAIADTYERLSQREGEQQSELAGIQDKVAETRAALDRYFRAFEAGTMPEDTCAPRIASLSEQAKALERHASELAAQQDDDEKSERVSAADLDALRGDLHAMLNDSDPKRVKGVLQAMIDGIRVDARDQIEPTFRVPAVRIESGYMEPTGIEPVTSCCKLLRVAYVWGAGGRLTSAGADSLPSYSGDASAVAKGAVRRPVGRVSGRDVQRFVGPCRAGGAGRVEWAAGVGVHERTDAVPGAGGDGWWAGDRRLAWRTRSPRCVGTSGGSAALYRVEQLELGGPDRVCGSGYAGWRVSGADRDRGPATRISPADRGGVRHGHRIRGLARICWVRDGVRCASRRPVLFAEEVVARRRRTGRGGAESGWARGSGMGDPGTGLAGSVAQLRADGPGRQSRAGGERREGSGAAVRRALRAERRRRARGGGHNEQRRWLSPQRTEQHGLVTCSSAARRCSRPRPIQVGAIGHTEEQIEDSLALSEDGTLTVLAVGDSEECRPKARPCGGFWAITRRRNGGWLRAESSLAKPSGAKWRPCPTGKGMPWRCIAAQANQNRSGRGWKPMEPRSQPQHPPLNPPVTCEPSTRSHWRPTPNSRS